jgi:hypothetical protein
MFDLDDITIAVIEILDPVAVPGADYFNWFFTLVVVFAMFAFGVNILVRLISRS